jgi:hypothetical protein
LNLLGVFFGTGGPEQLNRFLEVFNRRCCFI